MVVREMTENTCTSKLTTFFTDLQLQLQNYLKDSYFAVFTDWFLSSQCNIPHMTSSKDDFTCLLCSTKEHAC